MEEENNIEWEKQPLTKFRLSVRTIKALERVGATTIGDLTDMTYEEVIRVRNLGAKGLQEIDEALSISGMSLAKDELKELGLSESTRYVLKVNGVKTLEDLKTKTNTELKQMGLSGSVTTLIKQRLEEQGMELKSPVENDITMLKKYISAIRANKDKITQEIEEKKEQLAKADELLKEYEALLEAKENEEKDKNKEDNDERQ